MPSDHFFKVGKCVMFAQKVRFYLSLRLSNKTSLDNTHGKCWLMVKKKKSEIPTNIF